MKRVINNSTSILFSLIVSCWFNAWTKCACVLTKARSISASSTPILLFWVHSFILIAITCISLLLITIILIIFLLFSILFCFFICISLLIDILCFSNRSGSKTVTSSQPMLTIRVIYVIYILRQVYIILEMMFVTKLSASQAVKYLSLYYDDILLSIFMF